MEYVDILSEDGTELGISKPKKEAHQNGYWHKAVHIWILNKRRELLIQKRISKNTWCSDMWDISSAGHVLSGESSTEAAVRELKEELGINISQNDLRYLFTYKAQTVKNNGNFINNEYDDVYLLQMVIDTDKIIIQKDELCEVKWIHYTKIKALLMKQDKDYISHSIGDALFFQALDAIIG